LADKGEKTMPIDRDGLISREAFTFDSVARTAEMLNRLIYDPRPKPEPVVVIVTAYQGKSKIQEIELTLEEWNAFADWKQEQGRVERERTERSQGWYNGVSSVSTVATGPKPTQTGAKKENRDLFISERKIQL
jgi:hypothetical protein